MQNVDKTKSQAAGNAKMKENITLVRTYVHTANYNCIIVVSSGCKIYLFTQSTKLFRVRKSQ